MPDPTPLYLCQVCAKRYPRAETIKCRMCGAGVCKADWFIRLRHFHPVPTPGQLRATATDIPRDIVAAPQLRLR